GLTPARSPSSCDDISFLSSSALASSSTRKYRGKRRTTASDIFLQRAKDIRSYDSHVYYTYMLQIASNTYPACGWVSGRSDVVSWPFRLGNGPLGQTTHPREFRASSPPRIVIKFTICGASTFLPGKLLTAVEVSLVIRKSVQDGEGAINLFYE